MSNQDILGELIATALSPDDPDPLLDSDGNTGLLNPVDATLADYTEDDDAFEALREDLSPGEAEAVVETMRPLSTDEQEILDQIPDAKQFTRVDDAEHEAWLINRSRDGYKGLDPVLQDAVYGDTMKDNDDSGWGLSSLKKAGRKIGRSARRVGRVARKGAFAPIKAVGKVAKKFVPGRDAAKAKMVKSLHLKLWKGHANWLAMQDKKAGRTPRPMSQYAAVSKTWSKQKIGSKGLPLKFAMNGDVSGIGDDMMGAWYNPFSWFSKKSKEVLDETMDERLDMSPDGTEAMPVPMYQDPGMDPGMEMDPGMQEQDYPPPYESEGEDTMTIGISGDDSLGAFATEILSGSKAPTPKADQLVEIAVAKLRSGQGLSPGEISILARLAKSGHPRARNVYSVLMKEGQADQSGAWLHKLNPMHWLKTEQERKFVDIERDKWKENAQLQKELGKKKQVLDQAEQAKRAAEAVAAAKAQAAATEEQLKAIASSISGELIRDLNADVNGAFVGHENPTAITKVVIAALEKTGKKETAETLYQKIAKGEPLSPAELKEARQIAKLLSKIKVVHGDLIENEKDPALTMQGAFVGACILGSLDQAVKQNKRCQKAADILSQKMASGKPLTSLEKSATKALLKDTDKLRNVAKAHVTGGAFVGLDNAKQLQKASLLGAVKVMSPAEKKMLSALVKLAQAGNPRAVKALDALKKSGEIMGGSFVGLSLSSAFNYAMKPITVPTKYLAKGVYKGAKWTGQKLGIISKSQSAEQVRLAKMQAAAKRRAAFAARARAADANTQAELRAQQSIADAADAEADAADAEALAKEAAMRTKEIEADPSQANASDDSEGEFIGSWEAFVGLDDEAGDDESGAERKPNPFRKKDKQIIAKASEKSATGMKIRAGAKLYKKAKSGDKKAQVALKTLVKKAKAGDPQANRDAQAVKAGRLALIAKKKAQKRETVALARKARKARVVAIQKKFEARTANKLARMERKHNLHKLGVVERKAASGNPKARAYVAKQVAAAKKGDGKAKARVQGMKLAKTVRLAAPTRRERRNLLAARKLLERARRGDPKAIRQIRILEASSKAGNPNAKRALARLGIASAVVTAIATGIVLQPGKKKGKKGVPKSVHQQTVANAKTKLDAGIVSREELAAGARSAQALGDRKTAGELAVAATNTPSATESLKKTATVVAAKEAGNQQAKDAITSSLESAKEGNVEGIKKTGNIVAVQTIDDVNKGKPVSETMKDAIILNERIKAKDPQAIETAKKISIAASAENPSSEATMAAVGLTAAVALDKALASKPKAKTEFMEKVNPPLAAGEKTAAEAQVSELVAKANAGTITPEEGLTGIRLAEKLGKFKVAAELAAKAPPMVYENPLSSLPDMPLAPITGIKDFLKETIKAFTFSTRDPLGNYRGGIAARSKTKELVEPVSSSGWSPFAFFKRMAPFITPIAASTAAASSLTTLFTGLKQKKGAPAPAPSPAPAPAAPAQVVTKSTEEASSSGAAGRDFKQIIVDALQSKKISKKDFNQAVTANVGPNAAQSVKAASGEKILSFLKSKGIKIES
jgi:hypothetical protein